MNYIFIFVFVGVYFLFGMELGYTAGGAWWTHFTYSFQHGSLLHLIINCISWMVMLRVLQRFFPPRAIIMVAYLVAVAVSWVVSYPVPVVGASGMIYAMLGMYMALILMGHVRIVSVLNLWLFFASAFTFLAISFFKANSAGMLHLLCLGCGFAFVHLKKNI